MERILRIFSREYGNLNQAAILLGFCSLLSQFLGLFRDRLLAHVVGPGATLDVYYAAFKIPDFIFISVASLASITVLIPALLEKIEEGSVTRDAEKFLSDVFTLFLFFIIGVSIVAFVAMPYLASYLAPGFTPAAQAELAILSRILLLSPILLGLSNIWSAVTQMFRKFFVYALSPIFYNLGIIVGIVFLFPVWGIKGIVMGVIGGAVVHSLTQFIAATQSGFRLRLAWRINWGNIKQVVLLSFPRTLGLSLNSLSLIVVISLASYLESGSISIFNFSFNLQSVPLSIVGFSYAVAAFPSLSKSYALGNLKEYKDSLRMAARAIVFWSLPATFVFIVLRAQIVRVVLGTPGFSWEDTRLTAACLALFAVSVTAQGLIALFTRSYYAVGNTKKPLLISLISSVSIVLFSIIFLNLFKTLPMFRFFFESILKVSDIPGTEILMLPLAYSLGTILHAGTLWFYLKRDFMSREKLLQPTFFQSLSASFFVGVAAYLGLNILSPVFGTITFWGIFLQGAISGLMGILMGALVLHLLHNQEMKEFIAAIKTRFWRAPIIAPPQEEL